jgi:hypothetical protein
MTITDILENLWKEEQRLLHPTPLEEITEEDIKNMEIYYGIDDVDDVDEKLWKDIYKNNDDEEED